MQEIALIISLLLIGIVCMAFFYVIAKSGDRVEFAQLTSKAYSLRKKLFMLLIIMGVAIPMLTLPRVFAPIKAWAVGSDVQTIEAVGYQWYWEIDKEEVFLDKPVEFLLTSGDVSHGFGLYDEDMNIIAQAQVMPGYTNRVNVQFEKPGTYQILCMEYCGLAHHDMVAEITVIDPTTNSPSE